MSTVTYALTAFLVLFPLALVQRALSKPTHRLRGPLRGSWLLGNEPELQHQAVAGEKEEAWTQEFGAVTRLGTLCGEDCLLVSDPRALQHIFHAGYRYTRSGDAVRVSLSIVGNGLLGFADGGVHRRHRRVLNPGFTDTQIHPFAADIQAVGKEMVDMIKASLSTDEGSTVNILKWFHNVTLDVLGRTVFKFDFGALQGKQEAQNEELNKALAAGAQPSFFQLFVSVLARHLPLWTIPGLIRIPTWSNRQFARFRNTCTLGAAAMLKNAASMHHHDGDSKHIMDILLSSLEAQDPAKRLDEAEALAEMVTLIAAGQDTTSNTLGFTIYELAKHPDVQRRLRAELQSSVEERGQLSASDYDGMGYLNAVIKETLRLHPVAHSLFRQATADDVLPLDTPIALEDGSKTSSVPVAKGQILNCSAIVYNRSTSMWGDDATQWKPERFMVKRATASQSLGPVDNLLTFGGGNHSCIGWRLAMLEMQVIVALMVAHFDISYVDEVKNMPIQELTLPMVQGREAEGPQVPVRLVPIHA